MTDNTCTLQRFTQYLLKRAGIPAKYYTVYHAFKNTIEFDIMDTAGSRYGSKVNKYSRKLSEIFNTILKSSSLKDKFRMNIKMDCSTIYNSIRVTIIAYPDKNEDTEDFATLLKLEGIL